jgi:hypothetical protein
MKDVRRFTAEDRGEGCGDKPWEWCVIDEFDGLYGKAILFDLEETDARQVAEFLNKVTKT